MKELKDAQAFVVTVISAFSYFQLDTVLASKGLSESDKEAAINGSKGLALVVELPISARVFAEAPGSAVAEVTFMVNLFVQPGRCSRDINEILQKFWEAIQAYSYADENERIEPDSNPFFIVSIDEGVHQYALMVTLLTGLTSE